MFIAVDFGVLPLEVVGRTQQRVLGRGISIVYCILYMVVAGRGHNNGVWEWYMGIAYCLLPVAYCVFSTMSFQVRFRTLDEIYEFPSSG